MGCGDCKHASYSHASGHVKDTSLMSVQHGRDAQYVNVGNCEARSNRKDRLSVVRCKVLTAASMKTAVFWVVVPCRLVEVYRHFRSVCRSRRQGEHLRKVSTLLLDHTAHLRRRTSLYSLP